MKVSVTSSSRPLRGHDEVWIFQIAEVNKALAAVSNRVDNGNRVVFDRDDTSGQDTSYILNKKSGRVIKLRREKNVWVLDAIVAAENIDEDFAGQD